MPRPACLELETASALCPNLLAVDPTPEWTNGLEVWNWNRLPATDSLWLTGGLLCSTWSSTAPVPLLKTRQNARATAKRAQLSAHNN